MLSVDGLVTGFDTSTIIEELLEVQRRPITLLDVQIQEKEVKQTAYQSIMAKLLAFQHTANKLGSRDLFNSITVSSGDETTIVASGTSDLNPGSYAFRVAQLARTSQFASAGFATQDDTPIGAGTLTIETGRAGLERATRLEDLNGGAGVERGAFRISDRTGATATIDISSALTVQDVIDAINNSGQIAVTARIAGAGDTADGEGIVLADTSGGTGDLTVTEVGTGDTAGGLGLLGSAAADTLEGSDIVNLTERTRLSGLNSGNGVALGAGFDLTITQKNGGSFSVDLESATTVGDVLAAINDHADNDGVTVAIAADGNGLSVTDTTAASGTTTIAEGGTGTTARDLGLAISFATETGDGGRVLAGLNTTLLRELNGGDGVSAGSVIITDRAGNGMTVDLSAAETVSQVINAINSAAESGGVSITASLNRAGDGLKLKDTSGGAGNLTVAESGGGTTAADLGILSESGVAADELDGQDLHFRYITGNTRLDTLNGGRGIYAGSIQITDRNGITFSVNLGQEETISEVLQDINGAASVAGSDLTAAINDNGNGILITSPTGTGPLAVADLDGGTTAQDLNLAGTAAAGEMDGAFEHTITIEDDTTLDDLKDMIDDLDLQLNVSIINDGSADAPYRLFINGKSGGEAGQILLHTTDTNLTFQQTAQAQDAVVMSGSGANPLIIRNTSNAFNDIIPGLNITAMSESDGPIQVTATPDNEKILETVDEFVTQYNDIVDMINQQTTYDTETESGGILLGDSTVRGILRNLSYAMAKVVPGNPSDLNMAGHVGIRIGSKNKLLFRRSEFSDQLAMNRELVTDLFTSERQIDTTTLLSTFRNGEGVRRATGQDDFQVHTRDGNTFNVDLGGASTVQQVLDAINNADDNGTVTAVISGDSHRLVLTDTSTGEETFRVTALNSSPAFNDLGINKSADTTGGDELTGYAIDVSGDWGLGKRLLETLENMVNVDTGTLQLGSEGIADRIDDLKERREDMEERLVIEEERLRNDFAQLEVIMGQQQNALQQLTAAMSNLQK